MARLDKTKSALHAINGVAIIVRSMAYDGRQLAAIADGLDALDALDATEYLVRLLASETDGTSAFRDTLIDLTLKDSAFQMAIDRFDSDVPNW